MSKSYFFFGAIDRKNNADDGEILSEYPAWMHTKNIEIMEEEKNSLERQVKLREIDPAEMMYVRNKIKNMEDRIAMLKDSKPVVGDNENEMYKEYKELKDKISETMPSRVDVEKRLVDSHKEAAFMESPCIKVNPELAAACNVKTDNSGMVSRNGAAKMLRIIGAAVGKGDLETNIEYFRPDKVKGR